VVYIKNRHSRGRKFAEFVAPVLAFSFLSHFVVFQGAEVPRQSFWSRSKTNSTSTVSKKSANNSQNVAKTSQQPS
jgi:hypothetical protein